MRSTIWEAGDRLGGAFLTSIGCAVRRPDSGRDDAFLHSLFLSLRPRERSGSRRGHDCRSGADCRARSHPLCSGGAGTAGRATSSLPKAQATLDQARRLWSRSARTANSREVEDSGCRSRIALGAGADEEHRDRAAACNRPGGQELRPQAAVDADTAAAAQTRSAVDEAQANLAFEHEQLVVIGSSEAVARALVASAEAALLSAKFALIPRSGAPIDGIVANRKTRNRGPAAASQLPPGNGLSEKLASKREFSWLRGPATTETDTHWRSPFDR